MAYDKLIRTLIASHETYSLSHNYKTILMKKTFLKFLLSIVVLSLFINLSAQDNIQSQKLPVDSKVKIGKLENGFTYYIRTNQKPEKRLELRLVVNAGSILESDNQQGLAHFVEHMCFNGTTHFQKNDLVQYMQSIGVRFGADLNAYTSFDETVYKLTIPSDSTKLIEKGFLIMEDWAHNVTFDTTEINKERGVVVEEWRIGRGPWQRLTDKFLPVLFKDSHYAVRLPIGKKEIIENTPYDTLRSFYKDWYRPDLMALVVVGDIDPVLAEKEVKEHFSSIKMPEKPKVRNVYNVPDQPATLVNVGTDKEAPYSVVYVIYKSDVRKFETYSDYLDKLKYSCLTGMLNRRLQELTENENPPFVTAAFEYGDLWARTKNGLQGDAIVGEKGIDRGLQTLPRENSIGSNSFCLKIMKMLTMKEIKQNQRSGLKSISAIIWKRSQFQELNLSINMLKTTFNSFLLNQSTRLQKSSLLIKTG